MKAAVEEAKGIADLSHCADELEKSITALEYMTTELLAATNTDDSFLAYCRASSYLERERFRISGRMTGLYCRRRTHCAHNNKIKGEVYDQNKAGLY